MTARSNPGGNTPARLVSGGGSRSMIAAITEAWLLPEKVAGLQVPVHDPLPVRLVQSVDDLDTEAQQLLRRQRSLHHAIRQRLPLQQFHDQVLGALVRAHVVERADVGM